MFIIVSVEYTVITLCYNSYNLKFYFVLYEWTEFATNRKNRQQDSYTMGKTAFYTKTVYINYLDTELNYQNWQNYILLILGHKKRLEQNNKMFELRLAETALLINVTTGEWD